LTNTARSSRRRTGFQAELARGTTKEQESPVRLVWLKAAAAATMAVAVVGIAALRHSEISVRLRNAVPIEADHGDPGEVPLAPGGCLPTTLTVNDTGDGGDGDPADCLCDDGRGRCTLRAAIEQANSIVGHDRIEFAIAACEGTCVIAPASDLPEITSPVTIDGQTQPGSACGDRWAGIAPTWNVTIQGNDTLERGLAVSAAGSVIRGLAIAGYTRKLAAGLLVGPDGEDVTIECDYLHHNSFGLNGQSCAHVTIGGYTPGTGNVVSANAIDGIHLVRGRNITIAGNFVGTTSAGIAADGNAEDGVFLLDGTGVTIGGIEPGARNLISGNGRQIERGIWSGVSIDGGTSNSIRGNYVGTDRSGLVALGNGIGVRLDFSTATTIGDEREGLPNVVSGNENDGIRIEEGAADTVIQNNCVGMDASGGTDLRNGAAQINDNGTRTLQSRNLDPASASSTPSALPTAGVL
jgi:hypothetical protein